MTQMTNNGRWIDQGGSPAVAGVARWVFYLALLSAAALAIAAAVLESRDLRQTLIQACWVALGAAAVALVTIFWGRRRGGRSPDSQSTFFVDSRPGI